MGAMWGFEDHPGFRETPAVKLSYKVLCGKGGVVQVNYQIINPLNVFLSMCFAIT